MPIVPLANRRILVTRSRSQASDLAAQLEALGAATILIPTIEIAPPTSFDSLDQAIATVDRFDWLVFTSANAVESFARRRQPHATPPQHIAAIGPATAKSASTHGLMVDLVPPQAVAESLAATLIPHLPPNAEVLIVRAALARDHLPEALTAAGARVTLAEAYRTIVPPDSIPSLAHLFSHPTLHPDAITFTSSSTATNLAALLEAAGLTLPREIVRASIGPITSETLRSLALPPTLEAAQATIPSLVQALSNYFSRISGHFHLSSANTT